MRRESNQKSGNKELYEEPSYSRSVSDQLNQSFQSQTKQTHNSSGDDFEMAVSFFGKFDSDHDYEIDYHIFSILESFSSFLFTFFSRAILFFFQSSDYLIFK
jgi:hypothetical protein